MSATDFILQNLNALKRAPAADSLTGEALVDEIQRIIFSKKFRKWAASEQLAATVRGAISLAVKAQTPIKFLFPQGAYKLWRLDGSPNADWAELFFIMHIAKPLSQICSIYRPGVEFDLLLDDIIIAEMNNLPRSDIQDYIDSLHRLFDFMKAYLPANFTFKTTPVSKLFDTEEQYWASVKENAAATVQPTLTEEQKAMVELNVKPAPGYDEDPLWREKIMHLHDAHMKTKRERGYHLGRDDKVLVFSMPLPSGAYLSVGTTKNSVAKHWCGVGALLKKDDGFEMIILPPSRIPADSDTTWESVAIPGLAGPNFQKIRVL
jgi:hypothetical protein